MNCLQPWRAALISSSLLLAPVMTSAADWPMWRHDAARRGVSLEELPESLHLEWVLELPAPRPAWPSNQEKLEFDRLYEPVLAGKSLFVPSMISDKVTAYDTDSGRERWVFFAEGPVRFAPAVFNGKVYFTSDDGYLYCLDAADGSLVWKFRGGSSDRKVLGNDRLVSAWPARGAPVVYDGKVYFGASIWPFMGVFLHALDAETGSVVWTNSGTGSNYTVQQHGSPAFAGVAPQGYLAATEDQLLVAGGRTLPAAFDRRTGVLEHFNLSSRRMGSKGGGGYGVICGANFYLNRGKMYRLDNGRFVDSVDALIVSEHAIIGKDGEGILAYRPRWEEVETRDRKGEITRKDVIKKAWATALEEKIEQVFIKSGSRLYCSAEGGAVLAVDLPSLDRGARVSWSTRIPDKPLNMISGDRKLFVTTDRGRIYCFGEKVTGVEIPPAGEVGPGSKRPRGPGAAPRGGQDRWTALAGTILAQTGVDGGYCLALGIGSGRLVKEIAGRSRLHVIAIDPDARKVDALRRDLDGLGVYGTRIALLVGDPLAIELPPYMADLIVAEDPPSAGLDRGEPFVGKVFRLLRPYSGVACFDCSDARYGVFARAVERSRLDRGMLERVGELALLRRRDAPEGSADWTHQYADAANSAVSSDSLVRAPLGLLWFGGPSNEEVLPRHGHGPTPQVVGGRLFIEGRDLLRAVDIYTGRLLWERAFKDVGKNYDYTSHEPGANLLGSNYVSLRDGIYIVHEKRCLRLDPASGETISELRLPGSTAEGDSPEWGYIGAWKDLLVAGAQPSAFRSADYHARELRGLRGDALKKAVESVNGWNDFRPLPREKDGEDSDRRRKEDRDRAWFLANVNKLLADDDLVARIPLRVRFKADAEGVEKKLRDYLEEVPRRKPTDHEAMVIKRELLQRYYNLPRYEERTPGKYGSGLRAGSRRLVAMDRFTGEPLWEREASHEIRHNAIAVGGGRVFYIDRLSDKEAAYHKRRGLPVSENASVVAVDIRGGETVWSTSRRVFGTWLSYSEEHDVLLQAGSRGRDRALDEVGQGMVAYRGASGEVLWENDDRYSGPCLLLGDTLITQGYGTPGFALDLRTGTRKMRRHPVSGEFTSWKYTRNYGCNTAVGSEHLLTFRSAAAGYYDLARDSGTGNFGGFRSGCTSNLIPAGGILSAPDYTRTCTCSYQNQASVALVHMPEAEMWTFSPHPDDGKPVRKLGLNFGAPGDRLDADGTLWLDYPSVGGTSPDLPVEVFPTDAEGFSYPRYHSSRVRGGGVPWVASSALEGSGEIAVKLIPPEEVVVPNEVPGKSPLDASRLTLSAAVPVRALHGGASNLTSLQGTLQGKLEAVVAAYEELAVPSLTVEFWARTDKDFDYVDARGGDKSERGFVIGNRALRVRYFVSNASGSDNEPALTIESKASIPDNSWVHVAFSYDARSGVGTLYRDGDVVGRHDGPDNRPLWWGTSASDLVIGKDAGEHSCLDELRISSEVLTPERLLSAKAGGIRGASSADPGSVIGYWRMESATSRIGPPGLSSRSVYTVRLVFAEIEDLGAGQRVFDVALQGKSYLRDFDIAREAGGPNRTVIREFEGILVRDHLRITLSAKGGKRPLLSGVQVIGRSQRF